MSRSIVNSTNASLHLCVTINESSSAVPLASRTQISAKPHSSSSGSSTLLDPHGPYSANSLANSDCQPASTKSLIAQPTVQRIASLRRRRTRTLDLDSQPAILPRSSSFTKRSSRASSLATSTCSIQQPCRYSACSLPVSHSTPTAAFATRTTTTSTVEDSTLLSAGPSRLPLLSTPSSSDLHSETISTMSSAKSPVKRGSMVSAVSVADRAKHFQNQSQSTAAPARPAKSSIRKTGSSPVTQTAATFASASSASPSSSPLLSSSEAYGSSSQASTSHKDVDESAATIKLARRISVATPVHRRARSDVSVLDPYLVAGDASSSSSGSGVSNPPTIRTSSFAEIEELTAKLEANRPRSKTLALPHRVRGNAAALMHSIAEEKMHLRMCSSNETIRGRSSNSAFGSKSSLKDSHVNFQVSPSMSEDGSVDWHGFVSGNYGNGGSVDFRQALPISDLTVRKHVYQSKLCKADSPTLNEEATWLEEELARCSSDEDEDDFNAYGTVRQSMDEEYLTPDGSPLLSPVNVMAPPPVEIMGLGIQDSSLLLPGGVQNSADKSADSLLEQVAMHEACIRTLRSLSHVEREQATAAATAVNNRQLGLGLPSMPYRRSSLTVPTLRGAVSNGDFTSTQSDSSALFGDDTYDASMSPMADMGHDSTDSTGERRASAASYLSTDSTASADISIGSHGSSLLFNAHLAAPAMERGGSADTCLSTRPSSIASSCYQEKAAPSKPPRSPMRMNMLPLPPLPQEGEDCETPQPSRPAQVDVAQQKVPLDSARMNAMPLPPLPHEASASRPLSKDESARVLRKANRRKEGTDQPQLPVRLGSLELAVAAAPKETQLKEEFPDRLLGDWMATSESVNTVTVEQNSKIEGLSVEPVPLHKRILKKDGTTHLPGVGEIVPSSPDMVLALQDDAIPVYPAARKRLGLEPSSLSVSPSTPPNTLPSSATSSTLAKPTTTLKSKISGRFGLGNNSTSSNKDTSSDAASTTSKVSNRSRKSSGGKNESDRARLSSAAALAVAELPAAWKDRIVSATAGVRPSFDMRRPSLASLTSTSTHSSSGGGSSGLMPSAQLGKDKEGEGRSRSSLGFRKMLNSITGTTSPSSEVLGAGGAVVMVPGGMGTLTALTAATFESPKNARSQRNKPAALAESKYESFMELSDDESPFASPAASANLALPPTSAAGRKSNGRKDLTKMFGASEVDLSQALTMDIAAQKVHNEEREREKKDERRWTASLGRSNTAVKGRAGGRK